MTAILEFERMSVRYARWGQDVLALDNVSLKFDANEWTAIVGHNGSGKSTLLRAAAGLVDADSGSVNLDSRRLTSFSKEGLAKLLFLVHQNPMAGTAPLLTVAENLRVALPGGARARRSAKFDALLRDIGLDQRKHHLVNSLSGGERQLLALTVARLREPRLLLLDEPTAALDPNNSARSLGVIKAIHAAGATIIQVTHDERPLAANATRRIRMQNGQVLSDEPFPTFLHPDDSLAASLEDSKLP